MDKYRCSKKIFKTFIFILLIFVLSLGSYYMYIRNKVYNLEPKLEYEENYNEENHNSEEAEKIETPKKQEAPKYEEQKGITNILLIGTDARSLDENSRADSIIIATIDNNNKKLKFTSIMRDSYVSIYKHGEQKINSSYAFGGMPLLINTIEKNFNIKLDKYILVNFWGFQDIVDTLGGLDIDIKDYEVREINKYIGEVNENKSPPIEGSGFQHLDGQQVLAYTRIRKVGDGSYERNKRQREVLSLMANKLKDLSALQYVSLTNKITGYVKTNIEPVMIMNYAYTVSKFSPFKVEQLQIPLTELSEGRIYKGSWVFLMDKEQNADIMNKFIFEDKIVDGNSLDLGSFKRKLSKYSEE